jgi:simple sugar transport system permease protein
MSEALVVSLIARTIAVSTSLLLATLGEIYTERSGILNLGVEGIMMMGAATGFAASYHLGSAWLGLAAAIVVGMLLALLHAFLSITMRAEQVVSGLALTTFGIGLATFMGLRLGPNGQALIGQQAAAFQPLALPGLSKIPLLGPSLFSQSVLTYLLYLLIPLLWFFLYRTQPGLHLRAVGEKPQAADAMGVGVTQVRYLYTVLGGGLMGMAGAYLSLSYLKGWQLNITGGQGWIAIALVIFAAWDPLRAVLGALLFGGIGAAGFSLQSTGTAIPSNLLNMMPYILTIIVLVLITWRESVSKRVGAPSALGLPYVREEKR